METVIVLLIFGIGLVSYEGFRNYQFQQKYIFHVDSILVFKEYYRIFSSGFLHADWWHLIFNMIALSSFGKHIIIEYGIGNFILIYVASLVAGSLLSLYVHRNHGSYRSLGASGAVFGIMFSFIVVAPTDHITFIFIPMGFPAWLMGALFIGVSIWGIKRAADNIGHEAHLGGAVCGMLLTALIDFNALLDNLWVFALLFIPSIVFILYIIKNPNFLLIQKVSVPQFKNFRVKNQPEVFDKEERLNELLDKISEKGMDSLSEKEKQQLHELSKENQD